MDVPCVEGNLTAKNNEYNEMSTLSRRNEHGKMIFRGLSAFFLTKKLRIFLKIMANLGLFGANDPPAGSRYVPLYPEKDAFD